MKSPDDVFAWNIKCASDCFWKGELVEMCKCSLWNPDTLQHLTPHWSHHSMSVAWHADLYSLLLQARAASMSVVGHRSPERHPFSGPFAFLLRSIAMLSHLACLMPGRPKMQL